MKSTIKFLLFTVIVFTFTSNVFSQVPNYVPTNGLVGYWPFNGNANDESGNGNNGTVNGATLTTDRNGNSNSAYSFDGVNDFINVPDNTTLDLVNDFTISAWLNPTNFGIVNMILSKHDVNLGSNAGTYAMGLWEVSNYNLVNFQATPNYNPSTYPGITGAVLANSWRNFVVTYNKSSGLLTYYLDNTQIFSTVITFTLQDTNEPLRIGANFNLNTLVNLFSGSLDEIGIWNRVLTQQETTNLYTSTVPVSCLPAYVPTSGLVGYWPFCGNANDESGNGNDGTVSGATLTNDRFGVADKAYSFDGIDDRIFINNPIFDNGSNFTFSGWYFLNTNINPNNGNNSHIILNTSPHNGLGLAMNWGSSNKYSLSLGSGTPSISWNILFDAQSVQNIEVQSWKFITLVKLSNTYSLYVDGVLDQIWTANNSVQTYLYKLYFGGCDPLNSNEVINGKLDDITIYNRALTPQEITNLYTSTVPVSCLPAYVPTSGLVGYWPFCGNANDESGNGNNGTNNGATLSTDRNGLTNSSYSFSSDNQNITINGLYQNGISEYSVSGWFYKLSSTINQEGTLVSGATCDPSPIRTGLRVFAGLDDHLYYSAESQNCVNGVGTGTTSYFISDGIWHHFTAIFNSPIGNIQPTAFNIFIDGQLVNQNQYAQQINNLPTAPINNQGLSLIFGNSNCSCDYFPGKLDDIGIWNRALTPQEITNLYTSTVPPSVAVLSGDATICAGASTNLSVAVTGGTAPYTVTVTDGTNNYTATGASPVSIPVSPTATSTYTIVSVSGGGTGTGNTGTAIVTVIDATISASDSVICAGENTTLAVSLNNVTLNNNGNSILYSTTKGLNEPWLVNWPVTQGGNYQLKVFGTYGIANGSIGYDAAYIISQQLAYNQSCSGYQDTWLLQDGCPMRPTPDGYNPNHVYFYQILNSDGSVDFSYSDCCFGDNSGALSFELTELNSTSYLWSNGATTPTINVSPTSTTTYTCTTTTNGVSCTDSVTIVVNNPIIYLGNDVSVCGTSTTLTAPTGFDSYVWSNGATTNTTTVSANGTYSCTVTQGGCSASDSIDVTLIDATISASDSVICVGESVSLSIPQGGSSNTACAALPTNLQSGLVGYWPFCGNANDASGNGNNGTVNGATLSTDRFGILNSAYYFNGSSGSITINSNFYDNGWNENSIGLWFKPNSNNINGCLLNTIPHDGTAISFGNYGTNQKLYFGKNSDPNQHLWNIIGGNLGNHEFSYPIFNYNEWYFITITKNGNTYDFYINGVFDHSTVSTVSPISYYCAIILGNLSPNQGYASEFYKGDLDDFSVWNRALSAAEIQQIYNLGQTTYLWSNGATNPTINVSPTSTTTYTCTVTINGVSCTDSVTVVVNTPTIDLENDITACGTSTTLTAPAGYDSYSWSNGGTTNTTTVSSNGTYSCTVTQGGCSASDSIDVTLINATITASDSVICAGETVTLSIPQGGSSNTACAALPTNLQTGLVGYWPFCGNANDESGNGNNGTVNGATLSTDRFGSVNSAYSFDGSSNLIDLGNSASYNLQSQISISVWIYIIGGTQNPRILQFGNNNFDEFGIETQGTSDTSRVVNGYFGGFPSNASLTAMSWHHVAYVANRLIGTSSIYFDGQIVGQNMSAPGATINYNACNFIIGNKPCNNSDYWGGKIDDVGLYNRNLSATEIQQIYTLGQTSYSWSNGATTPSINVSPTSTTTYTCTTTTNGVSCSSNYTITVNNSSTSTNIVTAFDSFTWLDGNTYTASNNTATYTTTNAAGCDSVISLNLTITPSSPTLALQVFLDGYYTNGSNPAAMTAARYNNLVASGSATPGAATDVDVITVELRSPSNLNVVAYSVSPILQTNGSVQCVFPAGALGGSYYIVVKHRATNPLWSANPVTLSSSSAFSFANNSSNSYSDGSITPINTLVPSLFGIWLGELNDDGYLDGLDYPWFENETYSSVYGGLYLLDGDFNGDAYVDASDYAVFDYNSTIGSYEQRPY